MQFKIKSPNLFRIWPVFASIILLMTTACSHDEEVRMPDNIMGVWSHGDNVYMEFSTNNTVRNLVVDYQDGESIGNWQKEVYYYEPGYNLVLYITSHQEGVVYEVVKLTNSDLTWCPVDTIDVIDRDESIGQIIGNIIQKAQEGYKLDPELFESFTKVSEEEFLNVIESLDLIYPWNPWIEDDW